MAATHSKPLVWAEVNLALLQKNLSIIRSYLGGHTKILGVVKSDAYGHGACAIGKFLATQGIDFLGVGRVEEGIELRKAGIEIPILVMGLSLTSDAETIVQYRLTPMVCDLQLADALQQYCNIYQSDLKIHIRIDTGRGGIGVLPEHFENLLLQIVTRKRLRIEGIFVHPVSAYQEDQKELQAEITAFNHCVACATANGVPISLVHVASSPGIIRFPEVNYAMVRTGTALLGLPSFKDQNMNGLEPVMQLKTRILKISSLSGLLSLGYTCRVNHAEPLKIAVLPIGYGDAPFLMYLRDGEVLVKGKRAHILGKPCMGHLLIDVTRIPDIAAADEVVVFGQQQDQYLSVAEQAEKSGVAAICCESLCMLEKQVKRIYSGEVSLPVDAEIRGRI
jgi:alanine racemase